MAPKGSVPEANVQCEVRIATVMYGGVSLAIYMNGIAQELLHLVRGTATDPHDKSKLYVTQPTGTERVYRKLGRILLDGNQDPESAPVQARFVIDILSGTSAGGINAVFLAKALANDQPIDRLADLWTDEGGLERLINDRASLEGTGLPLQTPPQALLNGERMYLKLVDAFEGMDAKTPAAQSPYVTDGLDLFVTTTDIRGLPLQLRLWDEVVVERRHKNVFRLKYRDAGKVNHFKETNPFLAFACRATSSFPFAFEPMTLASTERLLRYHPNYQSNPAACAPAQWSEFFVDYQRASDNGLAAPIDGAPSYQTTAFGDGGYLDNKPFGWAIDVLTERQAAIPVQRKLIYIEPSPEHVTPAPDTVPNAIDNALAALVTLPGYETVREDLQRLLARNRLIGRVERILEGLEADVAGGATKPLEQMNSDRWRKATVNALLIEYGPSYGGYHRLRVSTVTDDLATLIASAANLESRSDQYWATRMLIRAWRKQRYSENAVPTENEFLFHFDVGYLERRLTFLRQKIDDLTCPDLEAKKTLLRIGVSWPDTDVQGFRKELVRLRGVVTSALDSIRRGKWFIANPKESVGALLFEQKVVSGAMLKQILEKTSESDREEEANKFVRENLPKLNALADRIAKDIEKATTGSADLRRELADKTPRPAGIEAARNVLARYHDRFEQYDIISFPILYSTDVGELSRVHVIRMAPSHADHLAGSLFFHFGAFLQRRWRVNDLLWGRLDGARRLITALLHDRSAAVVEPLVNEAQEAILAEFIEKMKARDIAGYLTSAINDVGASTPTLRALLRHVKAQTTRSVQDQMADVLRGSLRPEVLRDYYTNGFKLDRSVDPAAALGLLSRSTITIGRILDGISRAANRSRNPGAWIARLGQAFWGVVEIAVPGSLWQKVGRHWISIAALCGALMVVVGTLGDVENVPRIGWAVITASAVVTICASLLGSYIVGRHWLWRLTAAAIAILLVSLTVIGGWTVVQWIDG